MIFRITAKDKTTSARTGEITTPHGTFTTPVFMPVGTQGTVKGVHLHELENDVQADIILANAYHLFLRPGTDVIEKAGGIHCFTGWSKPILTDSGGYQVFSLAQNRRISEEGVSFQSHIDGSRHFFSPESAIAIQRTIGADFIMALDECTSYPCDYSYARESMERTHRWLERCHNAINTPPTSILQSRNPSFPQSLIPIVQGSVYSDLRRHSAEVITSKPCDAYAIGGLSVGEPAELMYEMTAVVCAILPEDKPRYLMGVGTPANILESIALGVDLFDCVLPTRNGRNGTLFTQNGLINIRNEKWKCDFSPVDSDVTAFTDPRYSRAYLRHLFIAGEMLGPQIASLHNLCFYRWLIREAQQHICCGDFGQWKNNMTTQLEQKL